jgi:hypothetical protein
MVMALAVGMAVITARECPGALVCLGGIPTEIDAVVVGEVTVSLPSRRHSPSRSTASAGG